MTVRPRRSALYLPASNDRAIAKARGLACDVVVLDLEDAVAPEAKAAARAQAVAAVAAGGWGAREIVVRVNGLDSPWGAADLAALAGVRPDAVLVPKVDGAADIAAYAAALPVGTPLWAMVETPRAVLRLEAIASAPALAGLVLGTNDLAKAMRATLDAERAPFLAMLAMTVAAARAFGRVVLDGVYNDLGDAAGLARQCAQAAAFGFDGKTLIHPSQIGICNAAFAPDAAALAWARTVVAAFALPENADRGVLRVDGQMVERLHLAEAEERLAVAAMLAARDGPAGDAPV